MAKFTYTATAATNPAKIITGEIEANSREDVVSSLGKQHLNPVSIKEGKKAGGLSLGGGKVKSDELVIFTRQLSAMIGAGVPLLRSLNSLAEHAENPAFKRILNSVLADIQGGAGFGEALEKYPKVFGDVYVNMVKAGESAGILDEILKRLATQQEKNATIRKKVKSAMAYPIVLVVITIGAFFGLMLFVIPQIGTIIKDLGGPDAKLPLLTEIMLGISDVILSYWYIIFPLLGGAVYGALWYIGTPNGKNQWHHLLLKIPPINGIIKKVSVARFARTYSSLIGAGVSVIEAINVTARAIGNEVYVEALDKAATDVKNGEQLSAIIETYPNLFPSILSQMLSVGEETGQTDTVLIKVADFYEEEVDVAIDGIASIIEPVMIVMMGSMVGLIAASVMGPIASMSQNIQ
ncbi:type II secretion system F family protein [Candidatus Saccharibacteria bacterium]|nr:type II secretion system F family protein [Candidatus Saccharibacteria bacterium]